MKYYSEILDTMFDTGDSLVEAEKEHLDKIKKADEERKEIAIVNKKKAMAKEIEVSEDKLNAAYNQLEEKRLKAQTIIDEAHKKAEELLKSAVDAVNKCQTDRVKAISAFNKEFGPFKTTYTGDKAQKEFDRVKQMFNEMFNSFFFSL